MSLEWVRMINYRPRLMSTNGFCRDAPGNAVSWMPGGSVSAGAQYAPWRRSMTPIVFHMMKMSIASVQFST